MQIGEFKALNASGVIKGMARREADGSVFVQVATHDQRELDKGYSGAPV